eukprot:6387471-Alexandrium_andersonii.AAC.1
MATIVGRECGCSASADGRGTWRAWVVCVSRPLFSAGAISLGGLMSACARLKVAEGFITQRGFTQGMGRRPCGTSSGGA